MKAKEFYFYGQLDGNRTIHQIEEVKTGTDFVKTTAITCDGKVTSEAWIEEKNLVERIDAEEARKQIAWRLENRRVRDLGKFDFTPKS